MQKAVAETIGGRLRQLRIERGLSVQDVSDVTRISISNIRAMEAQDFMDLPADTFTKGLLANYARFLGQDPEETVELFLAARNEEFPGLRPKHLQKRNQHLERKHLAEPAHISSATLAVILLLIIISLFAAFCFFTSWNPFAGLLARQNTSNQDMGMILQAEAVSSNPKAFEDFSASAGVFNTPDTTTSSAAEKDDALYKLSVQVTKDATVEVAVDDAKKEELPVNKGEQYNWLAGEQLVLVFSEPDSAIITLNDTTLNFPAMKDGKATLHIPEDLLDQ